MCFSSSTTRILEVIDPPIASIDHSNVRGPFYMCQRNVMASLLGSGPVPASLIGAQDQFDRVANESETVPNLLLEVAPVGEVKEARVVDEHHDGGGFAGGLRRVTELEAAALEARRRMLEERLAQNSIQLVG